MRIFSAFVFAFHFVFVRFFPIDFEMQFWNKWWWSQNRFNVEHTHTHINYYTTVHYRCDYVLWDWIISWQRFFAVSRFFTSSSSLHTQMCTHTVCNAIKNAKRSKWMSYSLPAIWASAAVATKMTIQIPKKKKIMKIKMKTKLKPITSNRTIRKCNEGNRPQFICIFSSIVHFQPAPTGELT